MKKTILKEVTFCDCCGEETYVTQCLRCGTEHCYECRKKVGKDYTHSVHCSGSGDGYYCNICDHLLRKTKEDEIHSAYVEIDNLGTERIKILKEIDTECKFAKIHLEQLQQKAKHVKETLK